MGALYPNFKTTYIRRFYLRRVSQTFYKGGCDNINELSCFKCSLASRINTLRDTAIELKSKDIFFKTWKSLLNNNGSLNILLN